MKRCSPGMLLLFCLTDWSFASIADAAESFDSRLTCSELINNGEVKDDAVSAKVTFYVRDGRLTGARYLKKHPGRELFEGSVDPMGVISISGNGSYDDPSRHHWTY